MNLRGVVVYFMVVSILTFVTVTAVTLLYNLILHGRTEVNWETSVQLGIILGIVLTLIRSVERRIRG